MRCTELSSPRTQWPQDTTDSDFTEGRFASINSSECIHTRYNAQNYAVTVSYPQGGGGVPPLTTNYIYYDNQWQVIEVRTDGTAAANVSEQMVWSAAYINAAILQDSYSSGVIQPNERLYFLQDADWNTTAVVGYNTTAQTWAVAQRFVYDSYGNITVLNADWSATASGTQPMVNSLYQGMQYDPITGLYYGRARWYSPGLGRWISQDPLQFVNGANRYQFEVGNPVAAVDPYGTGIVDCAKAIWELQQATLRVDGRVADMVLWTATHPGQCPDAKHVKALKQAMAPLEKKLDEVKKHCGGVVGAAIAMAVAGGVLALAEDFAAAAAACCAAAAA